MPFTAQRNIGATVAAMMQGARGFGEGVQQAGAAMGDAVVQHQQNKNENDFLTKQFEQLASPQYRDQMGLPPVDPDMVAKFAAGSLGAKRGTVSELGTQVDQLMKATQIKAQAGMRDAVAQNKAESAARMKAAQDAADQRQTALQGFNSDVQDELGGDTGDLSGVPPATLQRLFAKNNVPPADQLDIARTVSMLRPDPQDGSGTVQPPVGGALPAGPGTWVGFPGTKIRQVMPDMSAPVQTQMVDDGQGGQRAVIVGPKGTAQQIQPATPVKPTVVPDSFHQVMNKLDEEERAVSDAGSRPAMATETPDQVKARQDYSAKRLKGLADTRKATIDRYAATGQMTTDQQGQFYKDYGFKGAAPAAKGAQAETPETVRADFKAGKLTKEQATAKLKAMGYQ